MALSKVTYVDGVTIIRAKNLNDIQDELIRQGEQQAEDEAELALKANTADVETALALKADKSDTYTKAEVNEALGLKANTADVNEALALKADKTETYTKAQVDSIVEDAIAEAVKESEYSNFEMKSVSGDFIHITDGAGLIPVKDLKIGIDAVQDLHGYDAPWVGGAGVNKFGGYTVLNAYIPASGTITAEASNRTAVLPCLPSTEYTLKVVRSKTTGSDDLQLAEFSGDTEPTLGTVGTRIDAIGYNSTTNIAQLTFTTSASTKWLGVKYANTSYTDADKTIATAQLELGSSVGDFSPYANICPISGWTGAKVSVTGKNLWGGEKMADDIVSAVNNASGSTKGSDANGKYVTLIASSYVNNKLIQTGLKFKENTQYTFVFKAKKSVTSTSLNLNVYYTDGTYSYVQVQGQSSVIEGQIYTFVQTTSSGKTVDRITTLWGSGTAYIYYEETGLFEGVLTTDDFVPYDGHVYEVTWEDEAGTVYGGTLDVTTGVLTVDKAIIGGSSWVQYNASNGYKAYQITNCPLGKYGTDAQNEPLSNAISEFGSFSSSAMNKNIIQPPRSSSNTAYMALLESVDPSTVFLTYLIGTPQTYQLTPTEVLTLLGENNIFADTGAVEELIYRISNQ